MDGSIVHCLVMHMSTCIELVVKIRSLEILTCVL